MIKNELRIGNYIGHHDSDYTNDPKEIHFRDVVIEIRERVVLLKSLVCDGIYCSYDELIPIPLTPEILEKCGFIDRSGTLANRLGFGLTLFERLEIVWYVQDGYIRYQTKGQGFTHTFEHIKYLHQLQNLYFILTNKELEIKL